MTATATAGAAFSEVARGFYLEALLIDGDDIWYSDVVLGGVRKVGTDMVLLPDRTMIGGLLQNEDGGLLVSGAGGIDWVNAVTGATGTLLSGIDGVNEMHADGQGGLFFGTTDLSSILAGRRPGPSTLEHLDTSFHRTMLKTDLAFANGLVLAQDGSTLYFNESFAATRAFALAPDGSIAQARTLADIPDCDGMALDAEGHVWITGFSSDVLRCVADDGTEIRRLALPGKASTNVRFGGADMRHLYVTIVDPASAQALADGRPIEDRGSVLLKTRSPVPGAPIRRTAFVLPSARTST